MCIGERRPWPSTTAAASRRSTPGPAPCAAPPDRGDGRRRAPLDAGPAAFAEALRRENRTLKRALTDPRILSGIGNAYSDEILHRAGLSPVTLTSRLDDPALERLHGATVSILTEWVDRMREEVGDGFPDRVTAFRPEMAVHGKYRQPCPACGSPVRRIVYASNETNYCAGCQTGGRILADRALSRLLKDQWPTAIPD